MLKRNGQPCQRSVPDYSGRLTDFEFLAYNTLFDSIKKDFMQLSEISQSLMDLERSLPRIVEASESPIHVFDEIVPDELGNQWRRVASVLKLRKAELLFCKRQVEGEQEFSIVERLDPKSVLAQVKGVWQVQMTSNDARLLLQDFLEGERRTLKLYGQDIVAGARAAIEEKYPANDLSRVIKAIAERCANQVETAEKVIAIKTRPGVPGVQV